MIFTLEYILDLFARLDGNPEDEPPPEIVELEQADEAQNAANVCPPQPYGFPVVDVSDRAARATYSNGKNKRNRFRRVNLKQRKVILMLHQMGVQRSPTSSRWPLVTAHRVIGPNGTRYRLHPLDRRLVAGNRADRAPYHAVHIEFAGNLEGHPGAGNWWRPDIYGRGKLTKSQILAGLQECRSIEAELAVDYEASI